MSENLFSDLRATVMAALHAIVSDLPPEVADRVEVTSRRVGTDETWTWSSEGGGAFTLNSIDIANNYLQSFSPGSAPINFVGTKEGGGTVTFTYSPPVDNNLHTVTFSNFTDVVSVTWQQNFPYHQFDNVVLNGGVSETPEPGKLALLTGAGLTGMAFVNRRRSKKENLKCATIR